MTPASGPEDHDDPIEEVAANWLTLRSEGLSSSQKREFKRWRQADPRHATAEKGEALFQVFADGAVAMLERVLKWDGQSWEG